MDIIETPKTTHIAGGRLDYILTNNINKEHITAETLLQHYCPITQKKERKMIGKLVHQVLLGRRERKARGNSCPRTNWALLLVA